MYNEVNEILNLEILRIVILENNDGCSEVRQSLEK